ncbi:hypothetical protein WNY79_17655 [Pseudoalteromonas sp. AS84]|jgi:hypothetical protein|uniref:Transposase n=1 Tax=Pseudoalteromonas arctica TaxID=394751 RepID=A0A7X9U4B5_9GAMM|nr:MULTISPECIES: hypothetical protein [Pseudoalteromonas]MBL1384976.1 hypothetical protein [Colwellia sp.]KAA1155619.1 hypothetical protein EU510_05845 [Pseudoalteromonas sp. FUC4]MBH0076133.1 hypothetical protein [Pseudoalteromonas sp. SWYJ118]MDO6837272.1 hypothetical protein [Pseudoalteromonas carrageenovora]NMF47392.1 hypothetical protein [Pseudoalteromonas arctica]
MKFDALIEVQKLKFESKLIAGSRKKTSKLDKHKFELIEIYKQGSNIVELQRWLKRKGINAHWSTIQRWIKKHG